MSVKHYELHVFGLKRTTIMSNLHPLDVVSTGSETQFQVGENLNRLISQEYLVFTMKTSQFKTVCT